jgi:hypothetical protein
MLSPTSMRSLMKVASVINVMVAVIASIMLQDWARQGRRVVEVKNKRRRVTASAKIFT